MSQTILPEQVPVLSLASLSADDFADALGRSFREYGFAVVSDHGMDPDLIARGWALAKAFFALPDEAKRAYLVPGGAGQRGYTAFGTEIAKGASENDLKEFWHVGRELPAGHPLAADMPPNLWPSEIEGFQDVFSSLFAAFDVAGAKILSGVARHLGLPADWFDAKIDEGNSILRLLHYPPVSADAPGIRAGAHEDINLITLLLGAEEGGLQLLTKSGNWIAATPPPGALVINVGDMLQRLTNHVLPSTSHRVVNPPVERRHIPRYSMPFFLHLEPDVLIEALPQCVTADNPLREPPITAHDYLHQRLREIGLKM
ncbi:putative oxygenase/oxidoreductase [Sphingobium sp. SYK-6]|uniref:isopenicillin N synthase family dioxygenase n=1 Tax=Sphingobium sp. (strain NBRC 103272 / SYK-6) TaxID=627192 RepID=UPI0002276A20|nr:2-oxoglutarate and iron-dependent oxygenase domain-containing protein [Sphingobium sp. SYK-6]BAK64760.1 putative oxygenase/oxidoreductase [Sphingobium sp. SYK-6]